VIVCSLQSGQNVTSYGQSSYDKTRKSGPLQSPKSKESSFSNRQFESYGHYRAGIQSTGKGRDQAREASEISFHSLRHSAVTMLKAAGVSDFIAREIVGHESAAVSRQYTHLTTDDKRAAMQRLPDLTSALKINQPDVTTNEKP
jgi:integrase